MQNWLKSLMPHPKNAMLWLSFLLAIASVPLVIFLYVRFGVLKLVLAAITVLMAYGLYRFKKSVDSAPDPTREEIIQIITNFLEDKSSGYEWDDFTTFPLKAPELEKIRRDCYEVYCQYPSGRRDKWCSDKGIERLKEILLKVKSKEINYEISSRKKGNVRIPQ